MFLYHVFSIGVAKHFFRGDKLLASVVAVALSLLLGTASYYLIEARFLRLKSKFSGLTAAGARARLHRIALFGWLKLGRNPANP